MLLSLVSTIGIILLSVAVWRVYATRNTKRHTKRPFRVAIVGAGFSGLGLALKLKQQHIDFEVYEQGAQIGGTWYFNTYPGCGCDIPSHLYSFSFAPNSDWSRVFPTQPEILQYLQRIAHDAELDKHVRLNTRVNAAQFDESRGQWRIELVTHHDPSTSTSSTSSSSTSSSSSHQVVYADVLVSGMGGLPYAHYPDIAGRETFSGEAQHTSEWRAANVDAFVQRNAVIGVIGSGASAVQVIPALLKHGAQRMYVFQRTANWVAPKPDGEYSSLARCIFRYVPLSCYAIRSYYYVRQELLFFTIFRFRSTLARVARSFLEFLIRKQLGSHKCRDGSSMIDAVTPKYPPGCKRILISNGFYRALADERVTLVTEPITEIRSDGIVIKPNSSSSQAQQPPHELVVKCDAIVYATGFQVMSGYPDLIGRQGQSLAHGQWATVPRAYLGMSVPQFPNFFTLLGPNSALGHNSVVWIIECQIAHVVRCITTMLERDIKQLEVKQNVFDAHVAWLEAELAKSVWSRANCTSWYQNAAGSVFALWPSSTLSYWWETKTSTVDRDYDVQYHTNNTAADDDDGDASSTTK
jgi:cation diffusion facilitator CzcD-associated flavoprotein CzcO